MSNTADVLATAENALQPRTAAGPWWALLGRVAANRAALVAVIFIAFLMLVVAFGPWLAPHGYDEQFRGAENQPPWTRMTIEYPENESQAGLQFFPLGTDSNARDTLSRIIYGTRVSLAVGISATFIGLLVGVGMGLVSGFYGGWIDSVCMRFTDTVFAFPSVLLAVAITAIFDKPSLWVVFLALGLVGWTGMARVVRSQVLSLKTRDYISAARALGTGTVRILFRHILPNCLGPVIIVATLSVGGNILGEAGLSFLGLGVQEPYPSWGAMLAEARENYREAWWLAVFPGLAIVLTVLAFNLLGDGLRDALDPKKQQ